jgi:hypothetical protein
VPYGYGRRVQRKSVLEQFFSLIVLSILAGVLGGALVGIATDHHVASSSSSTGLGAQ